MTVGELIKKLAVFPDDMEVTITDGYRVEHYRGNYEVVAFPEDDIVDIGIGGLGDSIGE